MNVFTKTLNVVNSCQTELQWHIAFNYFKLADRHLSGSESLTVMSLLRTVSFRITKQGLLASMVLRGQSNERT